MHDYLKHFYLYVLHIDNYLDSIENVVRLNDEW